MLKLWFGMSLKINRRSEANAETMVCYPNSIR
jgi:hypothetical protein